MIQARIVSLTSKSESCEFLPSRFVLIIAWCVSLPLNIVVPETPYGVSDCFEQITDHELTQATDDTIRLSGNFVYSRYL